MDFSENLFDDPKNELSNLINTRLSEIKRKLGEMKQQIEQTDMMVQREQSRNTDIASELQTIQANLDSLPREDIRDKYNEALDARFRLATMRGQLEKFQNNFDQLTQEQNLLSQVAGKMQDVDFDDADDIDMEETDSKGNVNIVRIVEAQEEERQRLARQMHDGPAQSLTNFILQAEICQRLFDRNPERAGEELDSLKTAASVTFQKVRDFIFDLRPMMLDDLGFLPTVRRYIDSFREKSDIDVRLEIQGEERRLQSHREVLIFRSIQDLIVQSRDYATASQITVQLNVEGSMIKIMVQDNGRNFDAEAVFDTEEHHQDARLQGLSTLKEKFDLVGGTVTVASNESDGNIVRLEIPAN